MTHVEKNCAEPTLWIKHLCAPRKTHTHNCKEEQYQLMSMSNTPDRLALQLVRNEEKTFSNRAEHPLPSRNQVAWPLLCGVSTKTILTIQANLTRPTVDGNCNCDTCHNRHVNHVFRTKKQHTVNNEKSM